MLRARHRNPHEIKLDIIHHENRIYELKRELEKVYQILNTNKEEYERRQK